MLPKIKHRRFTWPHLIWPTPITTDKRITWTFILFDPTLQEKQQESIIPSVFNIWSSYTLKYENIFYSRMNDLCHFFKVKRQKIVIFGQSQKNTMSTFSPLLQASIAIILTVRDFKQA